MVTSDKRKPKHLLEILEERQRLFSDRQKSEEFLKFVRQEEEPDPIRELLKRRR